MNLLQLELLMKVYIQELWELKTFLINYVNRYIKNLI